MAANRSQYKRKIIVLLSGLGLFGLILILPPPGGMSGEARHMMAVAVLMAVWWMGEGTHIAVTALMPLVLFPALGIMPGREAAPNYGNHLVFLFLGGFMIALAMQKCNFHKRLALHIIARIGHTPRRIVLGFMAATAFLSMWISNTATTMMMLPVAMAVVWQVASQATLEGKRDASTEAAVVQNLGPVLMLALAYSASIGGVGTLIGTPPNIVLAGFYKNLFPGRPEISFLQWMVIAVPVVLVFLPLVWIYLCRFVPAIPLDRIGFSGHDPEVIERELHVLGPMSRAEKIVATVFVTTALLWMFRKSVTLGPVTLPGWAGLFHRPEYLHDSTVAMAMGLLLMILPAHRRGDREGREDFFVLDWKTVETGVPWGILLLFGGGFALASGFNETGLDQWVGRQLSGITHLPLWLLILLICLGITFLTELTSNTATATMILPILGGVAGTAGLHPLYLMIPATLSASFAFMLPVATPPNAIVFGSGWVGVPQMSRTGLALNLFGAALVTAAALWLIQMVFS